MIANNIFTNDSSPDIKEDPLKMDCSELIQTTSKELKTLMYKASKIICGDNLHLLIERSDKRVIEILEGTT